MPEVTEPSYLDPESEDYDHNAAIRELAGVCSCNDPSCEAGWADVPCVNCDW